MALHKWQGKTIIDPDHHADLERDSAAAEFGATRLDRKGAEDSAYKKYKIKQHGGAIGHHLRSLRSAQSAGRHEDADRHSALYSLHMKALGLKPGSTPPAESNEQEPYEDSGRFKSHPADQMLVEHSMEKSSREDYFKHADNGESVLLSEPDEDPDLRKSLASPMSLDQLDGQKVRVYFNLHNRLFSLQHQGRVVAHVPEVSLKDVNFKVNEGGRQRVLKDQRKNVHAFVEGTFEHKPEGVERLAQGVTYNPYKHDQFVRAHDKSPIKAAKAATLKNVPHPTITVEEEPQQHAEPSWIHGKS